MLVLLAIILPLLILYYLRRQKRHEEFWKHIMAIPGPDSIPILGTEYTIRSSEDSFNYQRELANKFYPIHKIWSFDVPYVFINSPEDIEMILTNSKHLTKGFSYNFLHAWLGRGLLTSEGTKWHKRRKILTPAFHFNILQEFTEVLNNETEFLVQELKKKCHQPYVDVVGPVTEFTLFAIGETSLGISLREDPNCENYKTAVYEFGDIYTYRFIRPWLFFDFIFKRTSVYKKSVEVTNTLHNFSENVIRERKKMIEEKGSFPERKRLALLDLMLKAKMSGADIDDEGIREELDTFIFAGHDTTSLSISHTLLLLANYPEIQEEVYEEIMAVVDPSNPPSFAELGELKYMERCIKESLRLFPSAYAIDRILGDEVKLKSGYTIPKGCNVAILIYDMHRSPQVWEDPDKFDPDRFLPENMAEKHPFSYIPFSAGSRNCIGQKYAMLELKTALCGIIRNFKLEPYDRLEHIQFKLDIVLRPTKEVRVKFVPRK